MTLFLSPAKSGKLTWGVGPSFNLPSASNPEVLGSGKFGLGPSGVVFLQNRTLDHGWAGEQCVVGGGRR